MRTLLVLIAALAVTGCASVGSKLDTWLGSDIQQFTQTIGAPTSVTQFADTTQYYWFRSGVINGYPITTCNLSGICTTTGGQPIHWQCHLTMVTDHYGIITGYNARGMC